MEAVKNDQKWKVAFPVTAKEAKDEGLDLENEDQVVWRNWPVPGKYLSKTEGKDAGKVACRVYKVIPAKRLVGHNNVIYIRLRRTRFYSN